MKKTAISMITILLSIVILTGCSNKTAPPPENEISDSVTNSDTDAKVEDKPVQIIRSIMKLDYASMTVAAFNEAVQQNC